MRLMLEVMGGEIQANDEILNLVQLERDEDGKVIGLAFSKAPLLFLGSWESLIYSGNLEIIPDDILVFQIVLSYGLGKMYSTCLSRLDLAKIPREYFQPIVGIAKDLRESYELMRDRMARQGIRPTTFPHPGAHKKCEPS